MLEGEKGAGKPGREKGTVAVSSQKGTEGGGSGTQRTGSEIHSWWTKGDLIREAHHLTAVIEVQSITVVGLNAKISADPQSLLPYKSSDIQT